MHERVATLGRRWPPPSSPLHLELVQVLCCRQCTVEQDKVLIYGALLPAQATPRRGPCTGVIGQRRDWNAA